MIGILGGGQLGRMLALAAARLGIKTRTLEASASCPAAGVSELVVDDPSNPRRLTEFSRGLSAVTYEFENIPIELVERLARSLPVYPGAEALRRSQDRLSEKEFFRSLGIATAPFVALDDEGAVGAAMEAVGLPGVLKTRRMGYDGKGQAVVRSEAALRRAVAELGRSGGRGLILEGFVPFDREVSIVAARGREGRCVFYPLTENVHRGGILRTSIAPAPASTGLERVARRHAKAVLEALDYVGVLAIEFFVHRGRLIANEMAPRVHNSGHWTIDGSACSQFENHVRAVCGLPLAPTEALGHAGMVNLIGFAPPLERLAALAGAARIHLYDKSPRAGRKIGHINILERSSRARDAAVARLSTIAMKAERAGGNEVGG